MTKPSSVALEHVTRGTYQREILDASTQTWAVGTEYEVSDVSDALVASTQDEMFSWIRLQAWIYSASIGLRYEWMLYRCLSSDGLIDMDDEEDMEYLFKQKKIFVRGLLAQPNPAYGLKMIKAELYNVKLSAGEEIRLAVRPMTAATDGAWKGTLEYRKIGG